MREKPLMGYTDGGPTPESSFSKYVRTVQEHPMLTANEELDLARRWRDQQDLGAAHRLVTAHMRLAVRIASGFRGYGLSPNDLISVGSVGLMHAARRFDPDRGFRFATYAMWWIRSAMQEHVLHTRSLVRMGTTVAQRRLFFNLRRLKADMHVVDEAELQPEQVRKIATTLNVSEDEVVEMDHRLAYPDYSLNAPVAIDGEAEWQDSLPDEAEGQEALLAEREIRDARMALLPKLLTTLNPRELHIIQERRLKDHPANLGELAQHYGVSRERIRQIEVGALEKLRKLMRLELAPHRQENADDQVPLQVVGYPRRFPGRGQVA